MRSSLPADFPCIYRYTCYTCAAACTDARCLDTVDSCTYGYVSCRATLYFVDLLVLVPTCCSMGLCLYWQLENYRQTQVPFGEVCCGLSLSQLPLHDQATEALHGRKAACNTPYSTRKLMRHGQAMLARIWYRRYIHLWTILKISVRSFVYK